MCGVKGHEKTVTHIKSQQTLARFFTPAAAEANAARVLREQKAKLEPGTVKQLVVVHDLLASGRPMTDYPRQTSVQAQLENTSLPVMHWSMLSGWQFAVALNRGVFSAGYNLQS